MSTDRTGEIVRQAAARSSTIAVTLFDNPRGIVPTGLNIAVRHAKGDVIVRVDGHCKIARDYVSRCIHHLRDSKVEAVGGPIHTIATTRVGQAIAGAMSSRFGVGPSSFRTVTDRTILADTVAFPAYTRAALELAGPFDEELVRNQDDEYNWRLRKLGGRLLLAADVKSDYYSRGSLRSLCRQYLQYGFYKVRVIRKHPAQMHFRQLVPPAFVLALLVAPVAASVSDVARVASLVIFGSYALATLVAAGAIAARDGWRQAPALVAAFPALHVSYGLGFLAGVVRACCSHARRADR
jgi:glycosyltransferase involved in cell wall biosynthesis